MTSSLSRAIMQTLPFELPQDMQPPLVLQRNAVDEIRVNRVRYRGLEWTEFQRWERYPDDQWHLTATVALQSDELAAVLAEFTPPDACKKRHR